MPIPDTSEMAKYGTVLPTTNVAAPSHDEAIQLTRQRLAGMEEFMTVTNRIFQQFVGNAKSGLTRVAKVLLKALG